MSANAYDPQTTWDAAATYTASGDTDILISNPNRATRRWLGWTIAASTPTIDPDYANPIPPGGTAAMVLNDTEKLWLVMIDGSTPGRANVED